MLIQLIAASAMMGNVLLFDDDIVLPPSTQAMTTEVASITPLHGVLLAHDALVSDELRSDLSAQQIFFSQEIDAATQFVLIESHAHHTPLSLPWPATDAPLPLPLIFFGDRDCCLQAYDQGGFDFVLQSPAIGAELPVRIRHAVAHFQKAHELDQRMRSSQTVALQALGLNAELGAILHCLEQCFNCADIVELSRATFSCLRDMGLSSCMTFYFHRQVNFYSDDYRLRPIEQQVISQTRGTKRIVDHGAFSLYHYDHISVLIRDMPLDNPERYGVLKDHICLLLNGVESRAVALETQLLAEQKTRRAGATANVIQDIIVDMDAQKRNFTNHSSELLETLLLDLRAEFSQLTLNENEERRLNDLVEATGTRMSVLCKESVEADKTFCHILSSLATTLRK